MANIPTAAILSAGEAGALMLTCASWQQAYAVSGYLLERRLATAARFLPRQICQWWEGEVGAAKEVVILLEGLRSGCYAAAASLADAEALSSRRFACNVIPSEDAALASQVSAALERYNTAYREAT